VSIRSVVRRSLRGKFIPALLLVGDHNASWCGKRDNDDDSEIKSYEQRCNCKHVAGSLPLPTNRREDDNTDHSYSREERGNEEEVENSHDRHSRRPKNYLYTIQSARARCYLLLPRCHNAHSAVLYRARAVVTCPGKFEIRNCRLDGPISNFEFRI
jgi:hypothetical protein